MKKKFQFNIKKWPHFVNGPICFGKWLKSLTFVAHFSHLKGFLSPQNEKAVSVAHVASGGSTLKVSIRFLKMRFWLICAFLQIDFDVFLAGNWYLRFIHKWKSWTSLFPVWWYCKIRVQVCAIKKPLGWPAVKNRGTLGSQPFWKIHVLYHSYFQKRYTWAA